MGELGLGLGKDPSGSWEPWVGSVSCLGNQIHTEPTGELKSGLLRVVDLKSV